MFTSILVDRSFLNCRIGKALRRLLVSIRVFHRRVVVCMHVRTYVCMYVYVCRYVCMCVCMYVYMYYLYMYIHIKQRCLLIIFLYGYSGQLWRSVKYTKLLISIFFNLSCCTIHLVDISCVFLCEYRNILFGHILKYLSNADWALDVDIPEHFVCREWHKLTTVQLQYSCRSGR
jgi:hypothetical protein